jgi:hypothetical protein
VETAIITLIGSVATFLTALAAFLTSLKNAKAIAENTRITQSGNSHAETAVVAAQGVASAAHLAVVEARTVADEAKTAALIARQASLEAAVKLNGRVEELVKAAKALGHAEGLKAAEAQRNPS